jgi:hypothetical protein
MELDDMKASWALINQRLEQQQAINLQIFKNNTLERANRALGPLKWGQMLQIAAGGYFMLQWGTFWVAHRDVLHLMVCGVAMYGFGLMLVLTAARNLYLQSRLDYGIPVLEIQRRVAALRSWRLREALLYGVTGCLIWVPCIPLAFASVGVDVWKNSPAVVWWNLAASVACLVLLYGFVRFSRLPGRERLKAWLDDTVVGRSVLNTQALIDEISRFESGDLVLAGRPHAQGS